MQIFVYANSQVHKLERIWFCEFRWVACYLNQQNRKNTSESTKLAYISIFQQFWINWNNLHTIFCIHNSFQILPLHIFTMHQTNVNWDKTLSVYVYYNYIVMYSVFNMTSGRFGISFWCVVKTVLFRLNTKILSWRE